MYLHLIDCYNFFTAFYPYANKIGHIWSVILPSFLRDTEPLENVAITRVKVLEACGHLFYHSV